MKDRTLSQQGEANVPSCLQSQEAVGKFLQLQLHEHNLNQAHRVEEML